MTILFIVLLFDCVIALVLFCLFCALQPSSISAAAANNAILLIVIGIGLLFLSVILNQILHKLRVAEVNRARVVLV